METPVLSKLQKKLSLTGKKNKKEIIKNVIVDPYSTYWPLVQNELEALSEELRKNLPKVKPVKVNVPWRLLKDTPKETRKHIRHEYVQKHAKTEKVIRDDNVIFGVNEVTKLLESDSCSAVLVADVIPQIVVKHIVELAVLQKIPVLVVTTLKKMLKDFCGLESLAVAIKKDFVSSPHLANIVRTIFEISKNYPLNDNHINAARSEILKDKGKLRCNLVRDFVDKDSDINNISKIKNELKTPNYHLLKTISSKRSFIPELKENHSNSLLPVEVNDRRDEFRTFDLLKNDKSHYDMAHQAIRKKIMKKRYKPLTVKRLKGNKSRQKDKNKLPKGKN